MHHSRFCAIVIDCEVNDVDAAASFWSKALGKEVIPPDANSGNYRGLKTDPAEPIILVQKVNHPSRAHLDIETDDLDAEVARLEKLGAKRVAFVKRWWVMEAPTGQRFCVVRPQRGTLTDENSNRWES